MSIEKITKKTYFELIKGTDHYNCGILYDVGTQISFGAIQERISLPDAKDIILNDCLKCIGAFQNTVDFIHVTDSNEELHEQKKGLFYRQFINGILFIFHWYDGTTVSIKAIL